MNNSYFQIQLGKDLKDVGLHVDWDPVTGERLTGGARNPEGIKVATDRRTRRIGITRSGNDPRRAIEYLRSRGCELTKHSDGFIEVGPPSFD